MVRLMRILLVMSGVDGALHTIGLRTTARVASSTGMSVRLLAVPEQQLPFGKYPEKQQHREQRH